MAEAERTLEIKLFHPLILPMKFGAQRGKATCLGVQDI